jgi:hypothetical protein
MSVKLQLISSVVVCVVHKLSSSLSYLDPWHTNHISSFAQNQGSKLKGGVSSELPLCIYDWRFICLRLHLHRCISPQHQPVLSALPRCQEHICNPSLQPYFPWIASLYGLPGRAGGRELNFSIFQFLKEKALLPVPPFILPFFPRVTR